MKNLHIYLIFFPNQVFIFRYIRLLFLNFLRNLKIIFGMLYNFFLFVFGLTHQEFLDCLFLGSISLLLFKFVIRLFFFLNPFWYINLLIYFFGCFIQKRYNLIKFIRESYVKVLKTALGKNYWYNYGPTELLNHFRIYGFGEDLPKINFFNRSLINFFFERIFIFFILCRLWILKNFHLFVFFNFFFNFFLIFNKFFIFSSFFSFFILFSRLSLYVTDYNNKEFFETINIVEEINPQEEYIESSWENAVLIGLIVSRTFYDRTFYDDCIVTCRDKESQIERSVYKKYIQINSEFEEYSEGIRSNIVFSKRKARDMTLIETNGEEGRKYKSLLQKKKKKRPLNRIKKVLWGVFPAWVSALLEQNNSIIWYKNATHSNIFTNFSMPYLTPESKNHRVTFGFFKDYVLRSNETTIKDSNDKPHLGMLPIKNSEKYIGYAQTRLCMTKKLTKEDSINLKKECVKKLKDNEIQVKVMPENFFPNLMSVNIPFKIISEKAFFDLFEQLSTNQNYVIPEILSVAFSFLDPLASKEQAQLGLQESIIYLNCQIASPHWTSDQKNDYYKLLQKFEAANATLYKLDNSVFGNGENVILQGKLYMLHEVNKQLLAYPNKPPVPITKNTMETILPPLRSDDFVSLHFSNPNSIRKELGGTSKLSRRSLYSEKYSKGSELGVKKKAFSEPFDE